MLKSLSKSEELSGKDENLQKHQLKHMRFMDQSGHQAHHAAATSACDTKTCIFISQDGTLPKCIRMGEFWGGQGGVH